MKRLNEAEARLMDVQATILTQQTAMLAGSTNIFNRYQHNKDFKDYHPPRSLQLNIPHFDEIGSLLEAAPEDLEEDLEYDNPQLQVLDSKIKTDFNIETKEKVKELEQEWTAGGQPFHPEQLNRGKKDAILTMDLEEYKVSVMTIESFRISSSCRFVAFRRKDQEMLSPRSNNLKRTEELFLNKTRIGSTAWVWTAEINVDLQLLSDDIIVLQQVFWQIIINRLPKIEVSKEGVDEAIPEEGIT